jgi:hypothetical protein
VVYVGLIDFCLFLIHVVSAKEALFPSELVNIGGIASACRKLAAHRYMLPRKEVITESYMNFLDSIVLYTFLCINNPSTHVKLRMFCRIRRIQKTTLSPIAPDGSKSVLMTLHRTHVYNGDWRSENEKIARTEVLVLNIWSHLLLKRSSEEQ